MYFDSCTMINSIQFDQFMKNIYFNQLLYNSCISYSTATTVTYINSKYTKHLNLSMIDYYNLFIIR